MDERERKEMGARIRRKREEFFLTQDELANTLKMKRSNVSSYESGRILPPSNVLRQLAEILHTTTDYLVGRTFNKKKPPVDEDIQLDKISRVIIQKFQCLDTKNQRLIKDLIDTMAQKKDDSKSEE